MKMGWNLVASVPLCAGLMLAQTSGNVSAGASDKMGGGHAWVGLLVASGCQNAPNTGNTAGTGNMPRSSQHEENSTWEQQTNQADRNSTAGTAMQRGTPTEATGEMAQSTHAVANRSTADMAQGTTSTGSVSSDVNRNSGDMNRNTPADTSANMAANGTTSSNKAVANEADRMATPPADAQNTRGDNTAMPQSTLPVNTGDISQTYSGDRGWMLSQRMAGRLDATCRVSSSTQQYSLRLPDGRLVSFDDASNAKIAQQLQSGHRVSSSSKIFRVVVHGTLNGSVISLDSIQI